MTIRTEAFPSRYEALRRLGAGGAGEVWAVRDRYTGQSHALKILAENAHEGETESLVREATALSGLEGLGVPRVLQFGTMPGSSRLYLLRELVEGQSLEELIATAPREQCLIALTKAADKITRLHRTDLLHGDIKPANIIVSPGGDAQLVDLGLAEVCRDEGTRAHGSTPRYAAPELLTGGQLTIRSEVHALGMTLLDILNSKDQASVPADVQEQLSAVQQRAAHPDPAQRYPSADEFAAALRGALNLRTPSVAPVEETPWPVRGIEPVAKSLLQTALHAKPGTVIALQGPVGSGRSVLLRRLAWTLGVEGSALVWIDSALVNHPHAIEAEMNAATLGTGAFVLVDDADQLSTSSARLLAEALKAGTVVVAAGSPLPAGLSPVEDFEVPPLARETAAALVRRAVPSLTECAIDHLLARARLRPGPLKRFISRIAGCSVVSEQDLEELLADTSEPHDSSNQTRVLIAQVENSLDRGRFSDAQREISSCSDTDPVRLAIAKARLAIGLGNGQMALEQLQAVQPFVNAATAAPLAQKYQLWLGRTHAGLLHHEEALKVLKPLLDEPSALGAEALTYYGVEQFRTGHAPEALEKLHEASERAAHCHCPRVEGLALLSAGTVHMQARHNEEALAFFTRALRAAEQASDASTLANVHSNLGVLRSIQGDIAMALEGFEASIDAGRRSGRLQVVRHALANLANTDLFLGRFERAQSYIDELLASWPQLGRGLQAQVLGLKADLLQGLGKTQEAVSAYERCSEAYEEQGQLEVASEARLSGVLLFADRDPEAVAQQRERLAQCRDNLGSSLRYVPLLCLAEAHLDCLEGNESAAREHLDRALEQARTNEQPEWIWRTLDARAEVSEHAGHWLTARRDREAALLVLEQIAAPLPRDLREVYWNDPKRHALRLHVHSGAPGSDSELALARTMTTGGLSVEPSDQERKLSRILEINRELLGEFDLDRLTHRVIGCAVEMLNAERGHVLLIQSDGNLSVHTSRSQEGDSVRAEFSRSIAKRVLANRQPVVSLDAQRDATMGGYASVHQLMLQAVACVPITARDGEVIGALYLETRHHPGGAFQRDLAIVQAFADQVGLAIATAQLVNENQKRANELAETNAKLQAAQTRLTELLGERTQKLKLARKRLRDARNTLYGHFGYQGLVGTSAAMRRVYSLIDRVKDTDVPVLIRGESGTGKEGACRAIHQASERNALPFLAINCGAIPEHLLESELFGHERGSFTGADRSRKGLLREAGKGTLLLDEIGEMPQKMQASLLRVLQERKVRPLGGSTEVPVECRFLFATHRNLREMVDEGRFREDLYYRIVVVEIAIPPLRDHAEDIALLVDHFLGIFAARYKRERKSFTKAALRRLMQYNWPGNVRQLEHVLLNAWVLSEKAEVDAEDLELPTVRPQNAGAEQPNRQFTGSASSSPPPDNLQAHLSDEKTRITEALAACNWNRVRAAERLGMPRRTFYRRLKQYDIQ